MNKYTALSNIDIMRKVPCKFYTYAQLRNVKSLSELLPKTLLLYMPHKIGHFCVIFVDGKGQVNFYDPLGYPPDRKGYLGGYDKVKTKYLSRLLTQVPKIIYNEHPLQAHHTMTCGHWSACRLAFAGLTNEEWFSCFKNTKNKDDKIIRLYNSL